MIVWQRFIIALIVIYGVGCSSAKHVAVRLDVPVDEVISRVQNHDRQITTLKGEGGITVESPEASNSGSFNVDLRKPDSVRVELNGPFGIHVGTLMMSREQYIFYNARENTATVGKPDGSTLRSMFRVTLAFDEILRAFTGEFFTSPSQDSLERFTVMDDLYVARYRSSDGIREYRIDPEYFVITSYRLLSEGGKPKLIAIASRFDDSPGVVMPRVVRVIIPNERRSVTIAYDDITVNEPVECSFPIPKQAEIYYR